MVGARTGIQGRAGPGSELPHLAVGVPVPCRGVGLGALSGFLPFYDSVTYAHGQDTHGHKEQALQNES